MNEQDKQKAKHCRAIKNMIWEFIDGMDEESKLSVIANVLVKYIHSYIDKKDIDNFIEWLSKGLATITKDDSNFNCKKEKYGKVRGDENNIIIEREI